MKGWDKHKFPEGTLVTFTDHWNERYKLGRIDPDYKYFQAAESEYTPVRVLEFTKNFIAEAEHDPVIRDTIKAGVHGGFDGDRLKVVDENESEESTERETIEI